MAHWAYSVTLEVTGLSKTNLLPPSAAVYHPMNLYPALVGEVGTGAYSPGLTVAVVLGDPPLAL